MVTDFWSGNEYAGLSTDTKPSNVPNGSRFYEIDSGKYYVYDADNDTWYDTDGNAA